MFQAEDNLFLFDGNRICSRFLANGLGFSKTLQSCIKGTPSAAASGSISPMHRESRGNADRKCLIVNFLKTLAETTAQLMPDRVEQHLPFFNKSTVYRKFLEDFSHVHGKEHNPLPPSESYFLRVWKQECSTIKVRKHHRFAKCSECEFLRSGLSRCGLNEERSAVLRERHIMHLRFIRKERMAQENNRMKAQRNPSLFCSFVIDGADKSAFGLPHFVFGTKSSRGEKIKVKLVGALEHGPCNHLTLFLLTEEYETGGNHVIETIHRVLQRKVDTDSKLRPTMFLQLDNCTRENKNRFVLAYLEMLIARNIFEEIVVSFLPIGHTLCYIDQCFSRTSLRLRINEAITMENMI